MIAGSIAALVTPFKENGDIDFDCYGRIIDFHIQNGSGGIVVLGTTGEDQTTRFAQESGASVPTVSARTRYFFLHPIIIKQIQME